jgi:Haem-binding domain
MKKKLKWAVIGLAAIFGLLQFTNPARTNPPVVNDLAATNPPPAGVTTLLHAACYDCHSYETKWPLYSRIAPSSWLVVSDVTEGRENLNFSDWPQDPKRAAKKLERVNEELDYREMPPKKYSLLHPDARLTEAQRQTLLDWTSAQADKLRAASNNQ